MFELWCISFYFQVKGFSFVGLWHRERYYCATPAALAFTLESVWQIYLSQRNIPADVHITVER